MIEERTMERFWEKVEVNEETGCWEWAAGKKPNGYGQFRVGDGMVYAHRFAWEAFRGPIPEGLQIDHLCRVRGCVNPEHLEPVDCRTNLLRGDTVTATRAAQTECIHGHPFNDTNTYRRPNGGRHCRECGRLWTRERRAKKRTARVEEASE